MFSCLAQQRLLCIVWDCSALLQVDSTLYVRDRQVSGISNISHFPLPLPLHWNTLSGWYVSHNRIRQMYISLWNALGFSLSVRVTLHCWCCIVSNNKPIQSGPLQSSVKNIERTAIFQTTILYIRRKSNFSGSTIASSHSSRFALAYWSLSTE